MRDMIMVNVYPTQVDTSPTCFAIHFQLNLSATIHHTPPNILPSCATIASTSGKQWRLHIKTQLTVQTQAHHAQSHRSRHRASQDRRTPASNPARDVEESR